MSDNIFYKNYQLKYIDEYEEKVVDAILYYFHYYGYCLQNFRNKELFEHEIPEIIRFVLDETKIKLTEEETKEIFETKILPNVDDEYYSGIGFSWKSFCRLC